MMKDNSKSANLNPKYDLCKFYFTDIVARKIP